MAKTTGASNIIRLKKTKTKRKGVHSKKKASKSKRGKNYLKKYASQGR